jgi:hypothetical protein
MHRRNSAERAVSTCKNHFIAGLCSTDPISLSTYGTSSFPKQKSRSTFFEDPASTQNFLPTPNSTAPDYNRTPLAPPGIKVPIHEKPNVRSTWSPHAVDGWYLGPAPDSDVDVLFCATYADTIEVCSH